MAKSADLSTLIELTRTTQTLLTHFQSSLAPSATSSNASFSSANEPPNPLETTKAATTLLKSHTTTLSLLLLTPPLTPSAIISKIGDVSSGVLTSMVAAASYTPQTGQKDGLGNIMRAELRAQVRRLLGAWGEVLVLVLQMAKRREKALGDGDQKNKGKTEAPSETEKQDILAATGVVWEACDALLKLCTDGVVGLIIKKAEEWRGTLMDAVEELKEWGEDIDEDDGDKAEGSDEEDEDGFGDEDEVFGAANKLRASDTELKEVLDVSVKKLKMVSMLYQALSKRRLKTFPAAAKTTSKGTDDPSPNSIAKLDELMTILRAIPETVDDLASGFYDLDRDEALQTLNKCCGKAKSAVDLAKQNWAGQDDEFTAWSGKWLIMFDAA